MKDQVESAALENSVGYNISYDALTEHLDAAQVSWQWFNVFGAKPILGRTFTSDEDQPGASQVAVLSYGTWQKLFGGEANVLGQTMLLDQKPYRVVGVMRSDFEWPRGTRIWTPIALPVAAYSQDNRFNEGYFAAVRLRPGVTLNQLGAGLAAKVREVYFREGLGGFGIKSKWGMAAAPLTEFAAGPLRKPLYVLFGVVMLVLLIASANVAGLFLARTSLRAREFSIRTALGASAGNLVKQVYIETLLLPGLATALGILLGPSFGRLLLWMAPRNLAAGYSVDISIAVLIFTAEVGMITSLIAGIGPALKIAYSPMKLNFNEGGRSTTASLDKQRLRCAFVIGEVALAFVLLAGTGMFLASLKQLQQINPGFNPHNLLVGTVYYSGEAYKDNQQRQQSFVTTALSNLERQPGVQAAAATSALPFSNQEGANSFHIQGRPSAPNDPGPHSQLATATAGYLKVMAIPLLAGRWIDNGDLSNTQPVVVIDQRLAHRYWPNQNPIGQHLRFDDSTPWSTVVGVVGTVRSDSLEEDTSDGMRYYPYSQFPNSVASFVMRTQGEPYRLTNVLKRAIAAADPTQTAFDISTLDSRVNASLASRKLIVWLLTAFAGLSLLLVLVGIYGLISYVTGQRAREIGIRVALGALRSDVVVLVIRSAFFWVAAGLLIGAILSFLATALLKHFFAEFAADVFPSLVAAIFALLIAGSAAGFLPARRAATTDPATTLRNE